MVSFEEEVKQFFKNINITYDDNTGSLSLPDFVYKMEEVLLPFSLDTKEKRNPYNMKNWTDKIKEEDCLILDELGIRKILYYTPFSGVIVRNNILNEYTFFSCLDLICMPKIRVNRKISPTSEKGKWIIDFNNVVKYKTMQEVFDSVLDYQRNIKTLFFNKLECYGNYPDETVGVGGIARTGQYRNKDYFETR